MNIERDSSRFRPNDLRYFDPTQGDHAMHYVWSCDVHFLLLVSPWRIGESLGLVRYLETPIWLLKPALRVQQGYLGVIRVTDELSPTHAESETMATTQSTDAPINNVLIVGAGSRTNRMY